MFKNGVKIEVEGNLFENQTTIDGGLPKIEGNKKISNVVYGRNGSGKTTISSLFNYYSSEEEYNKINSDNYRCVKLRDYDGNLLQLNDVKGKIFVFNEDFINKYVKFEDDGLKTIALIGENVDIDKQVKNIDEKIAKLNITNLEKEREKFLEEKGLSNPNFTYQKILKTLKSETGWAHRQKMINGFQRNASVNDDTLDKIVKNHNSSITINEYNTILTEYLDMPDNGEIIEYNFNFKFSESDTEKLDGLLKRKIQKNVNGQLSKKIYDVIQNKSMSWIKEVNDTMHEEIDYCPFCFRTIENDYKKSIIDAIDSVLSDETKETSFELEKLLFKKFEYAELPCFISNELINPLRDLTFQFNYEVDNINGKIHEKLDNIYDVINYDFNIIKSLSLELQKIIAKIKKNIDDYNDKIKSKNTIKENLINYNNYLSWQQIKGDYSAYLELSDQKNKIEEELKAQAAKKEKLLSEKKKLFAKQNQVVEAIDKINNDLAFIFLDSKRLRIDLDNKNDEYDFNNNKYVVYSNDKKVKLKSLSTGERNVIALCYFFSFICKGRKSKDVYTDENLIILDDPISSLDHDNIVGVYSFLKQNIRKFVDGNPDNRFLVFSHNYEIAYNIDKLLKDIYDSKSSKSPKSSNSSKTQNFGSAVGNFELKSFEINVTDLRNGRNQYNSLINNIYKYANNEESDITDLTIGNCLRKVLEKFSSFMYNENMEKLWTHLDEKNKCLCNYLYRILLNNESHTMTGAYDLDEFDSYEKYTHEDKINVARYCLVIIKELSESHLRAYLYDAGVKKVQEWDESWKNKE